MAKLTCFQGVVGGLHALMKRRNWPHWKYDFLILQMLLNVGKKRAPEMSTGVRNAGRKAHRPSKEFQFQTSVSACLPLSSVPLAETQKMTL